MKFNTKAVHIGQEPDPQTGAVIPPVYQTSTYAANVCKGQFEYTRHGNPNYSHLEKTLASLENASYATVYSSGMAAATALSSLLQSGDRVVGLAEVYGGTYRLFKEVLSRFQVDFILVDQQDTEAVKKALQPPTKILLFETPTNPLMICIDIAEMSRLAKEQRVVTVVDNTFASPYFQNPITLGADVVWHSTTKYISGHSDIIGGALITSDQKLHEGFQRARTTLGLNPAPWDTWLISRGVKTLGVRMPQHEKNALAIAKALQNHSKVKKVNYPGLEEHPTYKIATQQMSGFSGMLSVEFDLSHKKTLEVISQFKLFSLAISLGGVESLVNHSASMSHVSVPREERIRQGISDGLVRFSAGIEDTDDLLEDVLNSLKNI